MVPGLPKPEQRGSEGYILYWNVWFLKLDVNSTFHHLHLLRCTDRSNFSVGFRLWNAPTTFSLTMNLVLPGLMWNIVLAFRYDALVLSKDFDDHLANQHEFARFRESDLKLKPKKSAYSSEV